MQAKRDAIKAQQQNDEDTPAAAPREDNEGPHDLPKEKKAPAAPAIAKTKTTTPRKEQGA
jgi:hypothetical protein